MKRFWDKVEKTNSCWNWKAAIRGKTGYGAFKYQGKVYSAHRFIWFMTYHYFPKNLVCHKCDNRLCVNPNHLFEGSYSDNLIDAIRKGKRKYINSRKGELSPSHKLTWFEVREIRNKYKKNIYGAKKLGKEYGVAHKTIQRILNNTSWKE